MIDRKVRALVLTTAALSGAALALAALLELLPRPVGIGGLAIAAVATMSLSRIGMSNNRDEASTSVERRRQELQSEPPSLGLPVLLDATLDSLDTGIVVYRGNRAAHSNRAARGLLGVRLERVDSLLPEVLRTAVLTARDGGTDQSVRFVVDYPARTIDAIATRITLAEEPGDPVILVRLVDVSERLRVDQVRRDFVAAASHELKTPVTAIHAASETVLAALDDDVAAARRFADRIQANSEKLTRIVRDLLDLSRLESDAPASLPVDVSEVIREEVANLGVRGPDLHIDLDRTVVMGDRSDLGLAVRNLVENAMRYTDPGDPVTIACGTEGDLAVVTVEDSGVGIPTEDLPRIFERFYRVDSARSRSTGGTGLGLSIVRHVVEQHGGTVDAASELGVGSRFSIRLPSASSSSDRAASIPE